MTMADQYLELKPFIIDGTSPARSVEDIAAGYKNFRGKCKSTCMELLQEHPELELVRGHVFITAWPSDPEQPHWWLRKPDGAIIDPTWMQFPNKPSSADLYEEFDGEVTCSNCGKEGQEKDFSFDNNYCFCSSKCYGQFVGVG